MARRNRGYCVCASRGAALRKKADDIVHGADGICAAVDFPGAGTQARTSDRPEQRSERISVRGDCDRRPSGERQPRPRLRDRRWLSGLVADHSFFDRFAPAA